MKKLTLVLTAAWLGLAASILAQVGESGFVPLFNGRDLSGWVNVNCAPNTFTVRDNLIVSTGVPTGVMRTARQYENFILEMEWKHLKQGGNAGLFVYAEPLTAPGVPFARAIEVQVLDGNSPEGVWTGNGDLFSIHGAKMTPDRPHPRGWERCLPSEWRAKPAGEWNHYRVESRDGRLTLAVNGKVVSGASQCRPRKGYLCLESEGSECHFRNLKIKELPSSNPPAEETASLAQGHRSLYTGIDFSGWQWDAGHQGHWVARDWTLDYDGRSAAPEKHLWTAKEFRDFELIADWRLSGSPVKKKIPVILASGEHAKNADGTDQLVEIEDAGDSGIYLRDGTAIHIGCGPMGSGGIICENKNLSAKVRADFVPKVRADKPPGQWNRFVITLRRNRLTIVLNGRTVVENARLTGALARGRIGLQHRGAAIQFANLYVRELN